MFLKQLLHLFSISCQLFKYYALKLSARSLVKYLCIIYTSYEKCVIVYTIVYPLEETVYTLSITYTEWANVL